LLLAWLCRLEARLCSEHAAEATTSHAAVSNSGEIRCNLWCVCVCVCVCEREREREGVCVRCESVCVCVVQQQERAATEEL
jgi:hypothetical protein